MIHHRQTSKAFSGTRKQSRSTEKVVVQSCELYIESFRIANRGFVYFIWSSNESEIQSLKYESNGKNVLVKESLTMNMRTTFKNGREQSANTALHLVSDNGEQLDSIELGMSDWTSQYKSIQIAMGRGVVNVKMKKKQIISFNDEESESNSMSSKLQINKSRQINTILHQSNLFSVKSEEFETLKEELNHIKKQYEDAIYLNNKLKNDRDVLLSLKQELQLKIEIMFRKATHNIAKIKQHYQHKLLIRDHCYEEEIQELVSSVNHDLESSKKMVEMLVKQKIKLEEEVKPLNQKIKKLDESQQEKIHAIQLITQEQNILKEQILEEEIKYKKCQEINAHQAEQIETYKQSINILQNQLHSQNNLLQEKDQNIKLLEKDVEEKHHQNVSMKEEIQRYLESENRHHEEKQFYERKIGFVEREKQLSLEELDQYKAKLEELSYEMEFNENVIGQLKKQQTQKEEELYAQIDNIQKLYNRKIEEYIDSMNSQKHNLEKEVEALRNQRVSMKNQIKTLSSHAEGSEIKLSQIASELQNLKDIKENYQKKDKLSEENVQSRTKRLEQENKNMKNQIQNLKDQIRQIQDYCEKNHQNIKEDISSPREKSPKSMKGSKLRSFEDEIESLKKKLFDYETQKKNLQQIISELKENQHSKNNQEEQRERIGDETQRTAHFEEIKQKQVQISQLQQRVGELENLYNNMELKIQKIVERYPEVDIEGIENDLPTLPNQIIQYCNSEAEEEKRINQNIQLSELQRKDSKNNRSSRIRQIDQKNVDQYKSDKNIHSPILDHRIKKRETLNGSKQESTPPKKLLNKKLSSNQNIERFSIPINNNRHVRDQSAGSFDIVDDNKSGTSYVRVSHSNRIRQLEDINHELTERESIYQAEIEKYADTVKTLEKETEKVKNLLSKYVEDPKNSEKAVNQERAEKISRIKQNKQSQVFIEDDRVTRYMHESQVKDVELRKLINEMQEIENRYKREIDENNKKIKLLEGKVIEMERKEEQLVLKLNQINEQTKHYQKQIAQIEPKLRAEKETCQELKMTIKQLNFHLENGTVEVKKIKSMNEALEEKIQKMSANQLLIREISKEIQQLNKKLLDQTRLINHLKLQKDSLEEEMKIIKKKYSDQCRITLEWEEKNSSLDRVIEELKRKESKHKRQIQDGQEQVRKLKLQIKKIEDQLNNLNSLHSSTMYEKKKHLDEISQLQDQITRKQYEFNRVQKQLEKYKHRIQENEDFRVGKKNELRYQIERLESQLIKREKKCLEDTQEIKLLKSRLDFLERENKKMMEQKNQTYGEKLKYYVDEIANIKKLLDEYQNQNTKLKIQNSQFFEENQILKLNFDKLQGKYSQNMQNQENILNDLQLYMNEVSSLKERLKNYEIQLSNYENSYYSAKKELDQEKLQGRKRMDKSDQLEKSHQKLMDEVKQLKIKLSQTETAFDIYNKINQKLKMSERKKTEIQDQYKRLKSDYDNAINTFIYKKQDLEKAITEIRAYERRMKDQEIKNLGDQLNKSANIKMQRFQQEILDLYNQNAKLRNQLQLLMDQNGKNKMRLNELDFVGQKNSAILKQIEGYREENNLMKEEIKKKVEKYTKLQFTVENLYHEVSNRDKEIKKLQDKNYQFDIQFKKVFEENQKLKLSEKQLIQRFKKLSSNDEEEEDDESEKNKKAKNKKNRKEEQQKNYQVIQQYEMKLLTLDFEMQKMKEKQAKLIEDHNLKMKKLEEKMEEMNEAMKEHQKTLENHYESELQNLEMTLMKLSQELEEKMNRNDQLNDAIISLQKQNKNLVTNVQNSKYKLEEETEIFNLEFNKIKNKMKDAENLYSINIKALEDELTKQMLQPKNNTMNNSRIKAIEIQEKLNKRFEEKIKNKDKKIDQLKENIYTLEETILKMKKKQSTFQQTTIEFEKLRSFHHELQRQFKNTNIQHDEELVKSIQIIRDLKKEMLHLRESEEKSKILLQEKLLQNQSISCELKTIKELYNELQRQLQKRKHTLTTHLEEESNMNYELRMKESLLLQLEEKNIYHLKIIQELESQQKRKNHQIKKISESLQDYKNREEKLKIQNQKYHAEVLSLKKVNTQLSLNSQNLNNENKGLKFEQIKLKKWLEETKSDNLNKTRRIEELTNETQNLVCKYREVQQFSHRYYELSQKSRSVLGLSIEELVENYNKDFFEKENEINHLLEEIEELKFLNQRKFMDYDELKKQNFELNIKLDDLDMLTEQVDTLRKICDKLEEEKKNSTFKEEVMRMQLESLSNNLSHGSDMRNRIENILHNVSFGGYHSYTSPTAY